MAGKFLWKFGFLMFIVLINGQDDLSDINAIQNFVNEDESTQGRIENLFEQGTLTQRLDALRKEKLNCVKVHGVNPKSFDLCCGENYNKLSDSFLNIYKILEDGINHSFSRSAYLACDIDKAPCNELALFTESALKEHRDVYQEIAEKAEMIKDLPGVNDESLDGVLGAFKEKYMLFKQARLLISSYLFDSIGDIQTFIDSSDVPANFEYHHYNPIEDFDILGVIDKNQYVYAPNHANAAGDISTTNSADLTSQEMSSNVQTLAVTQNRNRKTADTGVLEISAGALRTTVPVKNEASLHKISTSVLQPISTDSLSVDDKLKIIEQKVEALTNPLIESVEEQKLNAHPDFNRGLMDELKARELVNAYISRGLVDKTTLDLTMMPSEVLKDIKRRKLIVDSNLG